MIAIDGTIFLHSVVFSQKHFARNVSYSRRYRGNSDLSQVFYYRISRQNQYRARLVRVLKPV